MFLSFPIDSILSSRSMDVFTGFLAASVQELWLIKVYRPLKWTVRDVKTGDYCTCHMLGNIYE